MMPNGRFQPPIAPEHLADSGFFLESTRLAAQRLHRLFGCNNFRGTKNMNTTELAAAIASEHGLTKTQANAVIHRVLKTVTSAAAEGTEVSLPGFGQFNGQIGQDALEEGMRRDG